MARILYSLLFYLLLPLVLLRLLYRAWRAPAYARRWRERFAWFPWPQKGRGAIWVHAVSVGETIAAVPLIRELQRRYPERPLLVTTMTPTGSERVRTLLGDSVLHVYAPYDLPGAVRRFLRRVQPSLLIIMETELWPNTLHFTRKAGVPIVLANARLSERSARGYGRVAWLTQSMFNNLTRIAAQGEADARRFEALGVPRERVAVTGSIKYDLQPNTEQLQEGRRLRAAWQRSFVWVAASTHDGEDDPVLMAHRDLLQRVPDALLILVPRHPERFEAVYQRVCSQGFSVVRRSTGESTGESTGADAQVLLGDTMGEMMMFFACADAALVGGSLIERGGHNPLEPASLGLPVLMGPHVFNFQEICNELSAEGGLIYVGSAPNLRDRLLELADDPALRSRIGQQGLAVVERNRGALERLLGVIEAAWIPPAQDRTR